MDRHVTPHVKRIKDALAKGDDPKDLKIGIERLAANGQSSTCRCFFLSLCTSGVVIQSIHMLIFFTDIQAYFGSDSTAGGIKFQYYSRIKPDVDLLLEARKNGIDCKDVRLGGSSNGPKLFPLAQYPKPLLMIFPEIQKHMAEDVTAVGIKWQVNVSVEADAKRLHEAAAAGVTVRLSIWSAQMAASLKEGKVRAFPLMFISSSKHILSSGRTSVNGIFRHSPLLWK
jgi:hypothetical protein